MTMTTEEQYRYHMHRYASTYMTMSYVVTHSPDFIALQEMGKSIFPFLLQDLNRTDEEWKETIRSRKNMFDSWAIIMLLWMGAETPPVIPDKMQGRHDPIRKVWLKWAEQNGYLPATPPEEKLGLYQKCRQWLGL